MATGEISYSSSIDQLNAELAAVRRELEQRKEMWQSKLDIAARVHQSLLPKPIRHPRIDVELRYLPMETVGGDYCQVLFPIESMCYVTLCDVTGHGIGSALLASRVSSFVRQLVLQLRSPVQIVEELNSFIFKQFSGTGLEFLSFFAAQLDFERGTVTHSGAGHPGAFLIRDGAIEVLESQNLLIGAEDQCLGEQPEHTLPIASGDRLLIYSDGLIDSMNVYGQTLGTVGLKRILAKTTAATLSELADLIEQRVSEFRYGPQHDDSTLIVTELKEAAFSEATHAG